MDTGDLEIHKTSHGSTAAMCHVDKECKNLDKTMQSINVELLVQTCPTAVSLPWATHNIIWLLTTVSYMELYIFFSIYMFMDLESE